LKIKDTSSIVSLLFWLNIDLLNLLEKSGLIFIAISLQKFQRNEWRDFKCNLLEKNKFGSSPACLHGNQEKTTNAK